MRDLTSSPQEIRRCRAGVGHHSGRGEDSPQPAATLCHPVSADRDPVPAVLQPTRR
jgi:hypothetical protein